MQHFAVYDVAKTARYFSINSARCTTMCPYSPSLIKNIRGFGFQDLRKLLWLRLCPNGTEGHTDGAHAAWPALQKSRNNYRDVR